MKLFEDKYFIEAKLRSLKSPFNNIAKTAVFEDVLYKCCLNNLTEGLIKSYPYNFVVRSLNQYGRVDGYNKDQGIIYLKTKENSKTIINNISKYLDSCGYFISKYVILFKDKLGYYDFKNFDEFSNDIDNINEIWLIIETKFDSKSEISNISYLYHLTEKKYLPKILKNGLIPKSKNKISKHPDRIYVVTNIKYLDSLIQQFSESIDLNDLYIIEIDYSKTGNIKLFNDPNYNLVGYYTFENITPKSIVDYYSAKWYLNKF